MQKMRFFWSKSQLRVENVLAPHRSRSKTVSLIQRAKRMRFFKMFIFPKNNN